MKARLALRVHGSASAGGRALGRRIRERLGAVLDRKIERAAQRIVKAVARGEEALCRFVRELEGSEVEEVADLRLRLSEEDRDGSRLTTALRDAIELAIANVERFHGASAPQSVSFAGEGFSIEEIRRPIARVGLYVPGGRASYPSTAIMTVVPARAAGVAEIVVATPAIAFRASAALRFTLARLGVDEIWGMGGAQAIAALAFGCGPIARVDLIAGPGNAWVTAAKRLVAGRVAVDGLMGPSELVIVAGGDAEPQWIAADLLAQAEHDPHASSLLITPSRALAKAVAEAVEMQLPLLGASAEETARQSIGRFGGALVVESVAVAARIANELAPEHLQLIGAEVEAVANSFEVAGAVFVGASCPEVFGDYLAGPSHVLPTCGAARFSSGLTVATFERVMHRLRVTSREVASTWAAAAEELARAEGLPAHAASAALRRRERREPREPRETAA